MLYFMINEDALTKKERLVKFGDVTKKNVGYFVKNTLEYGTSIFNLPSHSRRTKQKNEYTNEFGETNFEVPGANGYSLGKMLGIGLSAIESVFIISESLGDVNPSENHPELLLLPIILNTISAGYEFWKKRHDNSKKEIIQERNNRSGIEETVQEE